jgi:2-polyprenyl-3-methyl-5-hydroxy-6-metoxy-1,4-benzoquinol methylase
MQKEENILSSRFRADARDGLLEITARQREVIEKVKQRFADDFKLIENPCPCGMVSDHPDTIIAGSDRYGLPLQSVLCSGCGTVRIDPYLDEASLSDFYTNYYQEMYGRSLGVEDYFERQKAYGKKFLSIAGAWLKPDSQVLEFGCGAGGALQVFQMAGHAVSGIEYSIPLITYGQSRGIQRLEYGSLDEFRKNHPDLRFDLIFSNHVFEHVANPIAYLKTCLEILSPGGAIVCAVPDIYQIDKYIFPNSNLKLMLHIAHIYNYSLLCLESLGARLGMRVERLHPDPIMVTPTSAMPELWFKMTPTISGSVSTPSSELTRERLTYFKRTEENFLKGKNLLKAKVPLKQQLKNQLKKIIGWKK